MKKFFKAIKEWWIWLTSKKVGEMINDENVTYEDVVKAILEEL